MRMHKGWLLIVFAMLLSGCTLIGDPKQESPRSYLLWPEEATTTGAPDTATAPTLGVGPVKIAAYLDRPQIASRSVTNRLFLAHFDRWAEPLQDTVTRVLTENLDVMVPARSVVIYPWRREWAPQYQIRLQVLRFDGTLGQTAVIKATYIVQDNVGKVLAQQTQEVREAVNGPGYGPYTEALNRALNRFCERIATDIQRLKGSAN